MKFSRPALLSFLALGAFPGLAVLHAFAQQAPGGLTTAEAQTVRRCRGNLILGALDSSTALECGQYLRADGARVLRVLSAEDSVSAAELLGKTAALADLSAIAADGGVGPHELRNSLRLVLPCDSSALCGLGLGPEPEKILLWSERETAAGRGPGLQRRGVLVRALLAWESLEPEFRAGRKEADWGKLDLLARTRDYRGWLRARCQEPAPAKERARRLLQAIEEELPGEAAGPMKDCGRRLLAAAEGRAAPEKGADRGISQASDRMAGVTAAGGDKFQALGKGFDGSKAGTAVALPGGGQGGALSAPPFGELTPERVQPIAEALKKPLAEELRDTIVGRKLLEFYEGPPIKDGKGQVLNEMNLAYQRFDDPKFMALWDGDKINFSLGYLEGWLKKSNLTPERLLADKDSLAALAQNLAPVLVHEGTHQTQDAFFTRNSIPKELLNVEEEVGAAVSGALFVEEKLMKRGEGYVGALSELDNRLYGVYRKKGVEGIRHDRNRTYLNLELGSKFPLDRTVGMAFGNEWMQKDFEYALSKKKGSILQKKLSKEAAQKIDKYGRLMGKYEQEEDWYMEVQDQLDARAAGENR